MPAAPPVRGAAGNWLAGTLVAVDVIGVTGGGLCISAAAGWSWERCNELDDERDDELDD